MTEEIRCVHCDKKSNQDQWFITTAYALNISIEEVINRDQPVLVYFCPNCGLPNTRIKESHEEMPAEEEIEAINEEVTNNKSDFESE
ncbi:hypothetical protein DEAC_c00970 [Desulfosporosinus acididurans]|uniref:Uncharacterized protein n=1 Tax=Desulfosporosinus acididurans TaxID=476652 RepID=A0A0J1FXE5_9FIRM|nr:hypothetical protein [Desulfosporosinus acididurans]KLU67693.1 hypothetical protein DEAC_c00970 [Desulfosporosinus acididurans]